MHQEFFWDWAGRMAREYVRAIRGDVDGRRLVKAGGEIGGRTWKWREKEWVGQTRRGIKRGMAEWKWQREVIADAEIRGWKWRALRIKAICITAPLSFLMSFNSAPLLNLPTTQQTVHSSKHTAPMQGSRKGKKNAFKGVGKGRPVLSIDSSSFWSLFLFQSLADSSLLLLCPHFATIPPPHKSLQIFNQPWFQLLVHLAFPNLAVLAKVLHIYSGTKCHQKPMSYFNKST